MRHRHVSTTLQAYVSFLDSETPVPEEIPEEGPPPGRQLAQVLATSAQVQGLELTHPVSQWEGYGWEFTVGTGARSVWCMLQASDAWLLITQVRRTWLEKLRGSEFPEAHRPVLAALEAILRSGTRWSSVHWYTPEEWLRTGAEKSDGD